MERSFPAASRCGSSFCYKPQGIPRIAASKPPSELVGTELQPRLEVAEDADEKDIKKAYRSRAVLCCALKGQGRGIEDSAGSWCSSGTPTSIQRAGMRPGSVGLLASARGV